jgi:hypothetical protein
MIGPEFWSDMSIFSKLGSFRIPGRTEQDFLGFFKTDLDYFSSCVPEEDESVPETCETIRKSDGSALYLKRYPNVSLSFHVRVLSQKKMQRILHRPYLNPLQAAMNRPKDFEKIARILTNMLSYVRGSPTDGKKVFSHKHDLVGAFLDREDAGGPLVNADSTPSYRWLAHKANEIHDLLHD